MTGAGGMLGQEIVSDAQHRGHQVTALGHPEFDIADPVSSGKIMAGDFGEIDLIINCAAFTAVDKAESEPDAAFMTNGLGVGYLAQACAMSGVKLMHFSTDYVFGGDGTKPYTEEDAVNPIGAYGQSKRQGEEAVLSSGAYAWILRTSWLIGPHGKNFLNTMVARKDDDLAIVSDQTGTPTYAPFLAEAAIVLAESSPPPGIFHAAGSEVMTWYDLSMRIHERLPEPKGTRRAISTSEYLTPAKRPAYSALDSSKFSAITGQMPSLARALDHYFQIKP